MRSLLGLGTILILSCNFIDSAYINDKLWQHEEGFRIAGEFIEFDKDDRYRIEKDIIYFKGEAKAKIIGLNKSIYELKICSIDEKEIGYYINTEESLQ
jgi:hypothetical protein|tara:strand:- start:776 stop:1069 length:294 start_codon:yes stop_codon:yes gene_type:complete